MNSEDFRYLVALRRARSGTPVRTKLARTAAAGAMLVLPLSCGTGDEAAFAIAQQQPTVTNSAAPLTTTAPLTLSPTTGATALPAPTATETVVTETVVTASELLVNFTYQPSSAGQAKRPYVAVWIEDSSGDLVDTVSLWFEQGGKGTKWLSDLRQWNTTSGADDTTMSSATRVPGDYTVAWDGTDVDGEPVTAGDYVLNIEAAREHGPYSFTTTTFTIGQGDMTVALAGDGELSGATATLVV